MKLLGLLARAATARTMSTLPSLAQPGAVIRVPVHSSVPEAAMAALCRTYPPLFHQVMVSLSFGPLL